VINAGTHVKDICPWHQRLEAALIDTKHHWQSCGSMEKMVMCMRESERTSFWTFAKLKHLFLRATAQQPAHFKAINSQQSLLFKSKLSKQKGTQNIE